MLNKHHHVTATLLLNQGPAKTSSKAHERLTRFNPSAGSAHHRGKEDGDGPEELSLPRNLSMNIEEKRQTTHNRRGYISLARSGAPEKKNCKAENQTNLQNQETHIYNLIIKLKREHKSVIKEP